MTYCESIGLKIGDRIRVIAHGRSFAKGSVIELIKDENGDETPRFTDGMIESYFTLDSVLGGEGRIWEHVTEDGYVDSEMTPCEENVSKITEQSIDDLIDQLEKAIKKRNKHRAKFEKWHNEADKIADKLEKAIEDKTGHACLIAIESK